MTRDACTSRDARPSHVQVLHRKSNTHKRGIVGRTKAVIVVNEADVRNVGIAPLDYSVSASLQVLSQTWSHLFASCHAVLA